MKASVPLYILGFILIIGVIFLVGRKVAVGPNSAKIHDMIGTPEIRSAGQSEWHAAKLGDSVGPGDAVRTLAGSEIDLSWTNKSHVRLAANTLLDVIVAQSNHTTFESMLGLRLEKGKVWARLRKVTNSKMMFGIQAGILELSDVDSTCSLEKLPDGRVKVESYDGRVDLLVGGKSQPPLMQRWVNEFTASGKLWNSNPMTQDQVMAWRAKRELSGAFLVVVQPKAGERVSGDILTVSGYTDPGNLVEVNGSSVTVQDDGSWTLRTTPKRGEDISVTSRDEEGRQTNIVRKVTY